jgi:DUF1365 family protein
MALNSCLYECSVVHRRLRPKRHSFEHRIMMMYADLDELPSIHRSLRLLSHNRANLYSLRDGDYFPTGAHGDLKARVVSWLRSRAISFPADGRIRLLTLPRTLGYIFNPISVYFCADASDLPVCAIAEVGNTFGERKLFLLPLRPDARHPARFRVRVPKEYYVSPFSALDISFDFDCLLPQERLQVHIEDWDRDGKLLISHLRGKRVPLSDYQLARFALKFPALTLKVITLIHWHALRLALKRVPWRRKAEDPDLQRDVLNPLPPLTTDAARERHAH